MVALNEPLDPVCGMPVPEGASCTLEHAGRQLRFCSDFCRQQFERHPRAYGVVRPEPRAPVGVDWGERRIAYFSMEIALEAALPTYAGGLGVLAGDTLRSCADLDVPLVAVTLAHRRGYFRQQIVDGKQLERDAPWEPAERLELLEPTVTVRSGGRDIQVRAWLYLVEGSSGSVVPVILLDTNLTENDAAARALTDHLYGGDQRYRLQQEVILGIAGVRMLREIGCSRISTYHLNEGHAALAPLELLRGEASGGIWNFSSMRQRTVFTTHTPVAAGHDQFDWSLVQEVLGGFVPGHVLEMLGGPGVLNMTRLALNSSHYVNGVALRHREVSSQLFPRFEIHQITNGVHSRTWTCDAFKALFDRYIPGWRNDPAMLHNALALPEADVWLAHSAAKAQLLETVRVQTGRRLRADALTIGFARRATSYKRPVLILSDPERLRQMAGERPLQIIFAGKAHPRDDSGKAAISAVLAAAAQLGEDVPVVYLSDHDLGLGLQLVAGCDLWLNTPQPPLEASGTSGMKAAHNGVPSLSTLDGWWLEGHVEGVTGWSIGARGVDPHPDAGLDAAALYDKLERQILPAFQEQRGAWVEIMKHTIALNASFFNTHRMVRQYQAHAYVLPGRAQSGGA